MHGVCEDSVCKVQSMIEGGAQVMCCVVEHSMLCGLVDSANSPKSSARCTMCASNK